MSPPSDKKQWDGVDRRSDQPVIRNNTRMPEHVTLEDIWELMHRHIQEEERFRADMAKAFPKDRHGEVDYHGHGDYHQKLIDRAVKAELARDRLVERVVGGSLWALLGFVGIAVLAYVKDHMFK